MIVLSDFVISKESLGEMAVVLVMVVMVQEVEDLVVEVVKVQVMEVVYTEEACMEEEMEVVEMG